MKRMTCKDPSCRHIRFQCTRIKGPFHCPCPALAPKRVFPSFETRTGGMHGPPEKRRPLLPTGAVCPEEPAEQPVTTSEPCGCVFFEDPFVGGFEGNPRGKPHFLGGSPTKACWAKLRGTAYSSERDGDSIHSTRPRINGRLCYKANCKYASVKAALL